MKDEDKKVLDEILTETNKHADTCQCSDCYHKRNHKSNIEQNENKIAEIIDELSFEELINWADALNVEHDKDSWLDDEWPDQEANLRNEVAKTLIEVMA